MMADQQRTDTDRVVRIDLGPDQPPIVCRPIDLYEAYRHQPRRPSTFDRISAALDSPFWFGVYVGIIAGCFFVVGAAAICAAFL